MPVLFLSFVSFLRGFSFRDETLPVIKVTLATYLCRVKTRVVLCGHDPSEFRGIYVESPVMEYCSECSFPGLFSLFCPRDARVIKPDVLPDVISIVLAHDFRNWNSRGLDFNDFYHGM